jgi:poly(3-hydroxybutyrate) depolymerase
MNSKALTVAAEFAYIKPTRKIAGFIITFVWMCITPALFSQQNVHATLTPSANRKPAPAFQLITADGTKTQISDYRGKVLLLNFWARALPPSASRWTYRMKI